MFSDSPFVFRFRTMGRQAAQGSSWLILAPGLALTLMALAILIWPELLAYMVASALLFAGVSLTVWGWSLRRAERRRMSASSIYYEVR
jgi:hypothetical protein